MLFGDLSVIRFIFLIFVFLPILYLTQTQDIYDLLLIIISTNNRNYIHTCISYANILLFLKPNFHIYYKLDIQIFISVLVRPIYCICMDDQIIDMFYSILFHISHIFSLHLLFSLEFRRLFRFRNLIFYKLLVHLNLLLCQMRPSYTSLEFHHLDKGLIFMSELLHILMDISELKVHQLFFLNILHNTQDTTKNHMSKNQFYPIYLSFPDNFGIQINFDYRFLIFVQVYNFIHYDPYPNILYNILPHSQSNGTKILLNPKIIQQLHSHNSIFYKGSIHDLRSWFQNISGQIQVNCRLGAQYFL